MNNSQREVISLNRKVQAQAMRVDQLNDNLIMKLRFMNLDAERLSLAVKMNSDISERQVSLEMLTDDLEVIKIYCDELACRINNQQRFSNLMKSGTAALDKLPSTLTGLKEAGEHSEEDLGLV